MPYAALERLQNRDVVVDENRCLVVTLPTTVARIAAESKSPKTCPVAVLLRWRGAAVFRGGDGGASVVIGQQPCLTGELDLRAGPLGGDVARACMGRFGKNAVVVDESGGRDLRARMAELARDMQREHASVERTLQSITLAALDNVAGTAHAGITLVLGSRKVESRAATSAVPRKLDELQEQLGTGPCLQAIREHETVHIPDLAAETRWPPFTSAALGLGVASMLSFQLYTDGDNLGALTLYGATAHAFGRDAYDTGVALATHAAIALIAAQRQSQWESALASRDIIGQAKGMLMERYHIDALRAFDLLARLSQEANTKLADIARQLVEHDHPAP